MIVDPPSSSPKQQVTALAGQAQQMSRAIRRMGWIASGLPILFLLLDGVGKVVRPAPVVEATVELGYPEDAILGIGLLLLACVAISAVTRTAVLGAILLTGYLGGAVATHVRVGNGWFEVLFPVVLAALLWIGLLLRDGRLRTILPFRQPENVPGDRSGGLTA